MLTREIEVGYIIFGIEAPGGRLLSCQRPAAFDLPHQLGSGVMARAAGQSRDALNSYLPAFFTAGLVCVVATASLLLLRGRTGPVVPTAQPA